MPEIKKIAVIRTPFSSKFGIPRQSGLLDTLSEVVFEKAFRRNEAVRGLENFSHIWLIWGFSETAGGNCSLTVRPPRLGGNRRVGVFASRSPFRPNSLGLSSVRLEKIDYSSENAPSLLVRGADMLDGTPVYDIKPYIPYTDAHPEAAGGFAQEKLNDNCEVIFPEHIKKNIPQPDINAIAGILSSKPAPHYALDGERVFSFEFKGYKIRFKTDEKTAFVLSVEREAENGQ